VLRLTGSPRRDSTAARIWTIRRGWSEATTALTASATLPVRRGSDRDSGLVSPCSRRATTVLRSRSREGLLLPRGFESAPLSSIRCRNHNDCPASGGLFVSDRSRRRDGTYEPSDPARGSKPDPSIRRRLDKLFPANGVCRGLPALVGDNARASTPSPSDPRFTRYGGPWRCGFLRPMSLVRARRPSRSIHQRTQG
jgi:hypothetical protein